MNNKIIKICILFLIVTAALATVQSVAMDYPHNGSKSVACEDCHYIWGAETSLMITGLSYTNVDDDTQYNALCWSCHQPLGKGPDVETHSSVQLDDGYGDWSFECVECHDAHGNYQFRTYGSSSYIAQDTVATVNTTTLTRSATTPVWGDFTGMILVPNIAYDYNNYLITSNTNTSITVEGTIDTSKVAINDTFAVVYSNMIKTSIATPHDGTKTVKIFNSGGQNSFADADTEYDGICEVCHTMTTYHKNDGSGIAHNAGSDCMTCHQHTKGFDVACDICHGNPPVVNTATGGPDGLANSPGVTGSSTAGVHDLHVNTEGYSCTVCHYDSVGTGATHNNSSTVTMGFYLFDGAEQGGTYEGQSDVSYNATTTAPVTSVASNDNKTCSNIYCHSTGQSTTSGSDSDPTYASPVWDDPSSVVCGSCHKVSEGAGLSSGSHEAHLNTTGVAGCSECHTGAENDASAYNSSNHINRSIDVEAATSYDAGGLPGNGYGQCSTDRCHNDGVVTQKITPDWGIPGAGCSQCHLSIPPTGSHVKHVTTTNYNTAECGDCHDGAVKDNTAPSQHLDGDLDVYDASPGDLNYPQDVAKGGAPYNDCSAAYCHSPGQASDGGSGDPTYATVTWGDTAACGTCHKVEEGDGLTSGSHGEHLGTTGVNGCGDCHTDAADDATAYNSTNHVNKLIDVANTYSIDGTPGNGYGTCSAASCHDDGTGNLAVTPTWGSAAAACAACHDAAPETGSHTEHLSADRVCAECHKGAVEDTTAPVEHRDDDIDVYESIPGDLNYTADKTKGSPYETCSNIYCHGDYAGSGLNASPTWGTAADGACGTCHGASNSSDGFPDSGSHERHVDSDTTLNGSSMGIYNRNYDCTLCHKGVVSGSGPSSYSIADNAKHVSGDVDWSFDTVDSRLSIGTPSYSIASGTQAPSDGTGRAYGSCTVYCHSNVQPDGGSGAPTYVPTTWGESVTCGSCHGRDSHSAVGNEIDTGSHTKHLSYKFTASGSGSFKKCEICHKMGTASISTFECASCHVENEPTLHVNGTVNLIFDSFVGAGATYNDTSGTPGQPGNGYFDCSNIYCHSNATGGTSHTGDPRGVAANSSSDWGTSGPLACDSCHDGPAEGPGYTNGTPKANSHAKHTASYSCDTCHDKTVDGTNSIISTTWHVNKMYDVSGTPVDSYTYAADGGTCSAAACHGDSTPKWGGTVSCSDCHLGTGDVDDYTFNNATLAKLDSTEWTTQGHGRAGASLGCEYCHTASVDHNTSTNPFRLANYNIGGNGWNDTCYACHRTGSTGYDPGSGNKTSSVKVEKYHQMAAHSQSGKNGGKFCFDCHDPHGDSNIKMIQARPAKTTDGTYGIPTAIPGIDVVFTNNVTGTGAGGFARTSGSFQQGICNTCHTASAGTPKMQHYTSTSSDSHNSGQVCTTCHEHSNDTTVDGNAFAMSGDDCFDCHSSSGGPTPGTTPDSPHARHVQQPYVGKVSTGDYGKVSNGWYFYENDGGVPNKGCGYCHPQSSVTHMNGTINLNFDPNDTGAAGTMKAKNNATQSYTQVQRTSVTCSSVYCHSSGYFDGSSYQYKTSPNWYGGLFTDITPDKCNACHGNKPDTSSHVSHGWVGIHYNTIFEGTSGLLPDAAASGAGHGDPSTSTTINCYICHNNVVKMAANDKNTACAVCHSSNPKGTMVIDSAATSHVTGTPDIDFADVIIRSKAQIRDDITTVTELDTYWQRNNGYKTGANSYDSSKQTLFDEAGYDSGTQTCSTISCHNGVAITWDTNINSCTACHIDVPRTDQ